MHVIWYRGSCHIPKPGKEATTIQVIQGPGAGLKTTSQAKKQAAQGDGLSSTEVVTGWTCEPCSKESAGGEHGDDEATMALSVGSINWKGVESPFSSVGGELANEGLAHDPFGDDTQIIFALSDWRCQVE